jgi:decaprenylphospho-beta-D-erythro-pentofuranosid-2-ulose 2-reductase
MKDALSQVQSVLVLGGGSDIALATVRELMNRRTRTVVLAGRNIEALEAAAAPLQASGATVHCVEFDAVAFDTHSAFVAETWKTFGDLDLVLLAFGALGDQDADEHDPAAVVDVINANFTGAASIGVAITERLQQQGHGTLVALSSVAGERVRRANFVYGSAKAGMDAFFLGLGEALRGSGARVVVIRPGFVHTKMTKGMEAAPLAVTPERVATDIVKGLARGADLVWSPAPIRGVMSVLRHVPRAVFRRLPI